MTSAIGRELNSTFYSSPPNNKRFIWLPFVSVHALRPFQLDCAVLHPGLILCANSVCVGASSPNQHRNPVSSGSHCNRQSAACPWAWRIMWRLPTRASAGRGSWARMLGGSPNRIYLPWKRETWKSWMCLFSFTHFLHLLNISASHSMTLTQTIISTKPVCKWQQTENRTRAISDSDEATRAVWTQWQQTL